MTIKWWWERTTKTRFIRAGCYFEMAREGSLVRLASYELRTAAQNSRKACSSGLGLDAENSRVGKQKLWADRQQQAELEDLQDRNGAFGSFY